MKKIILVSFIFVAFLLGVFVVVEPVVNSTSSDVASEAIPDFDPTICQTSTLTPRTSFIGLAALSISEPEAQDLILELGVDMVRVEFRWDHIEPFQGEYSWDNTDRVVQFLRENNITILATLNHPPTWSHEISVLSKRFDSFLEAFVNRYEEDISYYEIFNEPNLPGYGWPFSTGDVDHDVKLYASVLTNANIVIRQHQPNAFIVHAGLSPDGIEPLEFIQKLHMHSNSDCYDIFAYHPYGKAGNLTTVQEQLQTFLNEVSGQNKPVWFAEFGTSDDEIAVDTLRLVQGELPELNGLIWFSLRDLKRYGWNFGLTEYDWEKKESFGVFKEIVEEHNLIE